MEHTVYLSVYLKQMYRIAEQWRGGEAGLKLQNYMKKVRNEQESWIKQQSDQRESYMLNV